MFPFIGVINVLLFIKINYQTETTYTKFYKKERLSLMQLPKQLIRFIRKSH